MKRLYLALCFGLMIFPLLLQSHPSYAKENLFPMSKQDDVSTLSLIHSPSATTQKAGAVTVSTSPTKETGIPVNVPFETQVVKIVTKDSAVFKVTAQCTAVIRPSEKGNQMYILTIHHAEHSLIAPQNGELENNSSIVSGKNNIQSTGVIVVKHLASKSMKEKIAKTILEAFGISFSSDSVTYYDRTSYNFDTQIQ